MVYTCCIPGCKTGYRSAKNETKIATFSFPANEEQKQKWIAAIPRKDWQVTKNSKVCAKHFVDSDIENQSKDYHEKRREDRPSQSLKRLRLKPGAIPRIFPNLPEYLSTTKSLERSKGSTSTARRSKQNLLLQQNAEKMFVQDCIDSFEMLKLKLEGDFILPEGYIYAFKENCCLFYFIQNSDDINDAPQLLGSVFVSHSLNVTAFMSSTKISQAVYKHFLNDCFIKSYTGLSNILAVCKSIFLKEYTQKSCYLDMAIDALKHYESVSSFNDSEEEVTDSNLIQFIVEQLQLSQKAKHGRRYSVNLLTLSFLWQLSSTSLYKKLRDILILPSISTLRQYSSGLTVKTGALDLSYLATRANNLSEQEQMVTLMIDEVYTAQRIEYSNGSFVGLTEEGAPAKTVLTFMIQSVCSKYKDVVCLLPVSQLDTALLQKWFKKVMLALDDLFFVIAVSVDNHICNRKLFMNLCDGELKPCIPHPTKPDELLFLLFDFTHNFKNIFNNFLNRNMFYIPTQGFEKTLGQVCSPCFNHIKKIYMIEENKTLKVAHKLKKVSLNPSSIGRTSPQHALGVFCESTARALQYYGKDYPELLDTFHFVKFISDVWKIMSLKTPSKGWRKKDLMCEPLEPTSKGFEFLNHSCEIFKTWKGSGSRGLTSETFLANIQSIESVLALTKHMVQRSKLCYILPGKFTSDAIEGRFGWYRQANGGNFFMSLKQLVQVEKKIRCISLLQQQSLQGASRLVLKDHLPVDNEEHVFADHTWLHPILSDINLADATESDTAVTYFVSGYIARSISRRRKCSSCKSLLIKNDDSPQIQWLAQNTETCSLLEVADRGGLAEPTDYCFTVCCLATNAYELIISNDTLKKKFISCNNHQNVFVEGLCFFAKTSEIFRTASLQSCSDMHNNFRLILQTAFNCFAKNELKRLNQFIVDAPQKMSRTVRKLTAKSSKE